ncbi:hypothetical protein Tco_0921869 [Tanacetum coccineum]
MLVQPTQDEGASSESQSVEQSSPSPTPTGDVPNESLPDSTSAQPSPSQQPSPTPIVPDSIPEHTGENLGDHSFNDQSLSGNEDAMTLQNVYDLCISLCKQVSDQAKEIELLKAKIKRLKKKATPVINHFKAYQKRISKEQRQQMVINSPCLTELSIPEQTATGKGTSNPLMAAEKARLLLKKDREYKIKKS